MLTLFHDKRCCNCSNFVPCILWDFIVLNLVLSWCRCQWVPYTNRMKMMCPAFHANDTVNGSCILFTGPINIFFIKILIKNRSYSTIHMFKNYFIIVFLVFNFQQNIWCSNRSLTWPFQLTRVGRIRDYFLWKPKFRFGWQIEELETRINRHAQSAFEMFLKFLFPHVSSSHW